MEEKLECLIAFLAFLSAAFSSISKLFRLTLFIYSCFRLQRNIKQCKKENNLQVLTIGSKSCMRMYKLLNFSRPYSLAYQVAWRSRLVPVDLSRCCRTSARHHCQLVEGCASDRMPRVGWISRLCACSILES